MAIVIVIIIIKKTFLFYKKFLYSQVTKTVVADYLK